MKILLLGEYSNVHWSLACGLRRIGHSVTVVSDGDGWKDYRRDIDVRRYSLGLRGTAAFARRLIKALPEMKGYDVVQIINPVFLPLKAGKVSWIYNWLRKRNKSMFLGAFGMDHFWVRAGCDCKTFRYSDFNFGGAIRHDGDNDIWIKEWGSGAKGVLNRRIAEDCDGIIAGLYEYYVSYKPYFESKLEFIPFPVDLRSLTPKSAAPHRRVRFFIGIQKSRSRYKGTDIMLRALERVVSEHPGEAEMVKAESVPFEQYQSLMNSCDVILDQLYSYTPAMNALTAMAKGIVVVGGGEEENYSILNEKRLRPIINVQPCEASVYEALKDIVTRSGRLPALSRQSAEYVRKHHEAGKVARRYEDFWRRRMEAKAKAASRPAPRRG